MITLGSARLGSARLGSARLGSWDSLPVNKCRPEPDYFVKPGAPALLLAAALALAPPVRGQTAISADATLAAGNSGVTFQNDVTLSVPDGATIGATDNISVSTTGGSTPQGTLLFQGSATVASRVGDAVDEFKAASVNSRVFKSAPTGRLKLIRITSASGATPTVTFTRRFWAIFMPTISN